MKRLETIVVPPSEGRRFAVEEGEFIRVTDVEGSQVADLIAFNAHDISETLSGAETLNFLLTTRPSVGSKLYSNRQSPMFEIVSDDSNGVHDFSHAACSRAFYEHHAGEPDHANCRENLLGAMSADGIDDATLPDPINLFQNTPIGPDGEVDARPGVTSAGDSIVLRALKPLIGAVSACAVDFEPSDENINGATNTGLTIERLNS